MIKLHESEKILLVQRKHWYIIATQGSFFFLAVIFPFIVAIIIFQSSAGPILREYFEYALLVYGGWLLLLWMMFFIMWTNYYLDALVITNKRVIDIEQFSLFSRDIVDVPMEKIQDIKVKVSGFLPTMLNFGDVHIQTAGQSPEIIVRNLMEPDKVQKIVSQQYHSGSGGTPNLTK